MLFLCAVSSITRLESCVYICVARRLPPSTRLSPQKGEIIDNKASDTSQGTPAELRFVNIGIA